MPIDGSGTPRARCLLAPNPSPMTLDGTNTWVLAQPGSTGGVVVDPGPADEAHLRRIVSYVTAQGGRIELVLLTHGHPDHAAGAGALAARTGAAVRALDPAHRLGEEGLGDGDVVRAAGLEIHVVATPGHSPDSLSFLLPEDGAVLTGDTVLGRGTTVIARDGRLGDYLDSLARLRALVADLPARVLLPGHGPMIEDPAPVIDGYLAHRRERLAEVSEALAAGDRTVDDIVRRVYRDVDPVLWPAAAWSVQAQLAFLSETGRLPPGVELSAEAGGPDALSGPGDAAGPRRGS